MKIFPELKVEEIKKQYLLLHDMENYSEYVFVLDGKALHDSNTFIENTLNKVGFTYTIDVEQKKDISTFIELFNFITYQKGQKRRNKT